MGSGGRAGVEGEGGGVRGSSGVPSGLPAQSSPGWRLSWGVGESEVPLGLWSVGVDWGVGQVCALEDPVEEVIGGSSLRGVEGAPESSPRSQLLLRGQVVFVSWFFPSASFCLSGHFPGALPVKFALGLAGISVHLSVLVFLFPFITIPW